MKLLNSFKEMFTPVENEYLEDKINWAHKIDSQGKDLISIVRDFTHSGGKKHRPALFYYAYKSYSDIHLENILRTSIVFEFIETFALIHDDIIDNANLRRGHTTVHKKYDIPIAILAGDFALLCADELFFNEVNEYSLSPENKSEAIRQYNLLKQETLIGEYLDYIRINDYHKITILKTSYYSFVRPVTIALSFAGAEPQTIRFWESLMKEIGVLYQVKDDLEGTLGDQEKTGKSTTSDIVEGKNTMLVSLFKEKATTEEMTRFNTFFGKSQLKDSDVEWYRAQLRSKGIDTKVMNYISIGCNDVLEKVQSMKETELVKLTKEIMGYINNFSTLQQFPAHLTHLTI